VIERPAGVTTRRAPGASSPSSVASQVTPATPSACAAVRISMVTSPGTTIGRSDSVCGAIGASTSTFRRGSTIGPPQERAYAVEPVAVAITMPSPLWELR